MHFNIKLRATKKRILAFILLALIPLSFVVVGLLSHLIVGQIVSVFSVLSWFLLPLIGIALLVLFVFADFRRHVLLRAIAIVLLLIGLVTVCLHIIMWAPIELFQCYENEDARQMHSYYLEETEGFPHMPDMMALDSYENVTYCTYYGQAAIFRWYSCMLIVRYSSENYVAEKDALPDEFTFQEQPLETCTPTVEVNGYSFRVLSVEGEYGNTYRYPKKLMLVGTNDETCEIAYLTFTDGDLDYIEDLATFILEACGFRYVR